jgi:hypothetical protein
MLVKELVHGAIVKQIKGLFQGGATTGNCLEKTDGKLGVGQGQGIFQGFGQR